jgi:predicted MPP superfamily phosphohydrolase
MQPIEQFRFGLFLAVVVFVYYLAASILVRRILRRMRGQDDRPPRRVVWFRRIVLSLAALGTLCILYGFAVEPYWPQVTYVRITSPKRKPGARPVRIVHISDLHSDPKVRLEERLPSLVAAQRPDLIVFTGDAINSPEGLPVFRRCVARLAAIAPTFVVRGNWDVWYWSGLDLFGDTGVRELRGEAATVEVGGTQIAVAGVPYDREHAIGPVLSALPRDAFSVFLYHTPDEIAAVAGRVDLYCAGHIHGGQIALPFYGALITLSKYGKRFESGLYRVRGTWLYVNRGIGMEGGRMPRVRFWARPEVTVIDIGPVPTE